MTKLAKKSLFSSAAVGISFLAALVFPNYFFYCGLFLTASLIAIWKVIFEVPYSVDAAREKLRFLVLPMIFNIGALYLTSIFFQTFAKALIALAVVVTNYFMWIALRKVHNLTDRAAIFHRNILIVISFVSVFLGSTTIFRLFMLFSTSTNRSFYQLLLVLLVFLLFYLISSFLTWENGADDDVRKLRPYNIVNSLLGAEVAWVSSIWIVNYPVFAVAEKANLGGTPLPAILLTIVFYFLWGIIFHKLDGSLTRRVLTEYIIISAVFIAVLLISARWLPTF
jgi:hypothetical protein